MGKENKTGMDRIGWEDSPAGGRERERDGEMV